MYRNATPSTSTSRHVLENNNYYPYGLEILSSTKTNNRLKFQGKELQTELHLQTYDFHARQYNPITARFTSIDPLADDFFAWGTYTFTLSNPLRFTDPSGMSSQEHKKEGEDNVITLETITISAHRPTIIGGHIFQDFSRFTSKGLRNTFDFLVDNNFMELETARNVEPYFQFIFDPTPAGKFSILKAVKKLKLFRKTLAKVRTGKGVNSNLLKSAIQLEKGRLTKAGHSLQKHGNRQGSVFPKVTGNSTNINAQAKSILENMINNPNATIVTRHHARFGDILEIRLPNGQGVRYSADGKKFFHFLEP